MQKPVALQSIVASQHLHAKIRYQRTLAFITNREAISVKLLHDVHSFLAPNTPRGSLSKVHPRGSLLEIHFQRFTPIGSLPGVHSRCYGEARLWFIISRGQCQPQIVFAYRIKKMQMPGMFRLFT